MIDDAHVFGPRLDGAGHRLAERIAARADGSGGRWPLMKNGMTGTCMSGVKKCSGTVTE